MFLLLLLDTVQNAKYSKTLNKYLEVSQLFTVNWLREINPLTLDLLSSTQFDTGSPKACQVILTPSNFPNAEHQS